LRSGILATLWDVVVILGCVRVFWKPFEEKRILLNGQIARGIVLGKEKKTDEDEEPNITRNAFDVPAGARIESTMRVDPKEYDNILPGRTVTIFYARNNPKKNVVYDYCDYTLQP
jgi:hypothetical protein